MLNDRELKTVEAYLFNKPHITVALPTDHTTWHIETTCPICRQVSAMTLFQSELLDWATGTFVQDAFPSLTVDERELLISGMDSCYDELADELEDN